MKVWQKILSHFWGINLRKYESKLNGTLFVNAEYGKKVLHTKTANYSYQKLHEVLKLSLKSIYHRLPNNPQVLNLGLGGGSAVVILRERLKVKGTIVSVEHDPVIVKIAKDEFNIDRFLNHEIHIEDAMDFVKRINDKEFDLIICDLFKDTEVPEKFKNESFFLSLLQGLNHGGNLIFNFVQRENSDPFFMQFLTKLDDQYEFHIQNIVRENHVLILYRKA